MRAESRIYQIGRNVAAGIGDFSAMVATARKLADSVALTLGSRLAIIVATAVLPVAGWYGQRIVDAGDKALAAIARLETKQELLEQKLQLQLEAGSRDREQLRAAQEKQGDRIRLLELGSLDRPRRGRDN